jgi:iduronate 2-sulfatase
MVHCVRLVEMPRYIAVWAIKIMLVIGSAVSAAAPQRLNVLFITVDDLRPQLGCYGHGEMVTPSLDRLAQQGRRFNQHYAQVPTCGASRLALLTGQYPSRPNEYDNEAFEGLPREETDGPISLPQLFQRNGYATVSIGKVTHAPDGMRSDGTPELPFGWDEVGVPHGQWQDGWSAFFAYAGGKTRVSGKTSVTERADVPDDGYPDALIADAAIAKLRELQDRPFFLAVGFFKPHLPFNAPSRYWDLYNPAELPSPPNQDSPNNVDPAISLHNSGEMRGRYTGFSQRGIVTDDEARNLRHAYRACVSYVDAQIGRVIEELDRLGLAENTVIVVWGDHGWHLGEHGIWGKHTLHEVAMRSPLLVRTPNMSAPGIPNNGLIESVDIYPTLAELCGLTAPSDLVGNSFVSQLNDPDSPGKAAVYGFWRGGRGHSIRTPRYRLVLWTEGNNLSRVVQTELYDQRLDPNETENIAAENPLIVQELTVRLRTTVPLLQSH